MTLSHLTSRIGLCLAIAGAALITACGGGSDGNPSNPYDTAIVITPSAGTAMPGQPYTFNIHGGQPPYYLESSNPAVLDVPAQTDSDAITVFANQVSANTSLVVQAWDKRGRMTRNQATVTVVPTLLYPEEVWVTPATSGDDCNTAASTGTPGNYTTLCSGAKAVVEVQLKGGAGTAGGLEGRQIRFDVIQGDFKFRTTNPGSPLQTSTTITTDALGYAAAPIEVLVGAPTQVAKVRATEVASGSQVTTEFFITGSALTILPSEDIKITTTATDCSNRQTVAYSIYGGTPPYRITANPQGWVSVNPAIVDVSGGGLVVSTTGGCFEGATLDVVDAEGRHVSAKLSYTATGTVKPTPAPLAASPLGSWGAAAAPVSCASGTSFNFAITGGTSPYSVTVQPSGPTVTLNNAVGTVSFNATSAPTVNQNYSVFVVDKDGTTKSMTLYCKP